MTFTYTEEMRARDQAELKLAAENIRDLVRQYGKDAVMKMMAESMDQYLDQFKRSDGTVDIVAMMGDTWEI